MKIDLIKEIENKFKKYNFVPLKYQIEIIESQVLLFFGFLLGGKQNRDKIINFNSSKSNYEDVIFRNENSYGNSNGFFSIINIDVGLGKTIISLISMEIIKESLDLLLKHEEELLNENFKNKIIGKSKFEIELINNLKDNFEKAKNFKKDFKIPIVARKSISREFSHLIKKENDYFEIFASGRGLIDQNHIFQSSYFDYLKSLLLFNHNDFLNENYDTKVIKDIQFLAIVDEWGTDPLYFQNGKQSDFISNYFSYVIGLTANTEIKNGKYHYKTRRFLKNDEDVRKELIEKKVYSFQDFLYKFINIGNSNVKKQIEELSIEKNKAIELMGNSLKSLTNVESGLKTMVEEIFNVSEKTVDETIKKINLLKGELIRKNAIIEIDEIIKNVNYKIDYYQNSLSKNLRENFYEIFDSSNLQYLSEKNTIIIYDENYTKEQISTLKNSFKEDEYKILNTENFRNIDLGESKGNILIGSVKDISKGLNLQNFDAIIFSYIDNISIEDIYQGIGRLDRLGLSTNKEILLLSYDYTEEQINKIISKKEEFNKGINLNLIKTITKLDNSKQLVEINQLLENAKEKTNNTTTKLKEVIKVEENTEEGKRLKEKILFIKENQTIFKEMLKEIKNQYEQTEKTIKNLLNSEQDTSLNTKYLESILSII